MARRKRTKIPVDKPFFDLSGGLHTESSALNFPDNVTLDEENFEMMTDGTRKRRRALTYESGIASETLDDAYTGVTGTQIYKWKNVNNDSTLTLIVVQLGTTLYFYEDDVVIGDKQHPEVVDLAYYVQNPDDLADFVDSPVSFAHGRGKLFVANAYIDPLAISYEGPTEEFEVEPINLKLRAFEDFADELTNTDKPNFIANGVGEQENLEPPLSSHGLPGTHEFNLRNRGWVFGSQFVGAEKYAQDVKEWPSKQMQPYSGFYSQPLSSSGAVIDTDEEPTTGNAGSGWFNLGSQKGWSSDKIQAEVFGNSYVPRGSLIFSAFNNENPEGTGAGFTKRGMPYSSEHSTQEEEDLGWPKLDGARLYHDIFHGPYLGKEEGWIYHRIVMKDALPAGSIEVGDVVSTTNLELRYVFTGVSFGKSKNRPIISHSRSFEITDWADEDNGNWIEFRFQVYKDGTNVSSKLNNAAPTEKVKKRPGRGRATFSFYRNGGLQLPADAVRKPDERPAANAWFAGRLFHAGMNTKEFADTIFFSKTVLNDTEYGQCFQAADPTHPELNELIATDGGTIQIPNVGNIIDMRAMESGLLVFSDQGVWEITGSNFFSATDIRVRQITSAEAVSANGIIEIDNGIVYTSHRGIYLLARSGDASGAVVAQNIIEETVQTYWNDLKYEQQARAQLSYDESKSRVYILHSPNNDNYRYDTCLIFDFRIGGFFKYVFPESDDGFIVGAHSTDQSSQPDEYQKMKFFIVNNDGNNIQVADFSDATTFTDFDGTERVPFLVTGYDNLQDFSRKRFAPTIFAYMATTETGVNEEAEADNTSSCWMHARWDFATAAVTGKWGAEQQVYRRTRAYIPEEGEDGTEGYDVIVTRNKIRGRGRTIQLKFEGEEGKDCHILGFAIHYEVMARV